MDATGDLQVPGCLTPCLALPLLASRARFLCIRQIPGDWTVGTFGSRYLSTPRPTRGNKLLLPSLLPIPDCASCPMVHGHCQAGVWRSGGHTHSQPRLPACTIPNWVELGSLSNDY